MCLYRITERIAEPTEEEEIGWKVFKIRGHGGGGIDPWNGEFLWTSARNCRINVDTWEEVGEIFDLCASEPSDYDEYYPCGIHAYTTEEKARDGYWYLNTGEDCIVVKVHLKQVTVRGQGDGWLGSRKVPQIVARKMLVKKEDVEKELERRRKEFAKCKI